MDNTVLDWRNRAIDKLVFFLDDAIRDRNRYQVLYNNIKEIYVSLNSCNDCFKGKTCEYAPKWGESVRYNCPHWEACR